MDDFNVMDEHIFDKVDDVDLKKIMEKSFSYAMLNFKNLYYQLLWSDR